MKVTLEELEEGDEIIISSYSQLKYLRVVRRPLPSNKVHWRTGAPLFSTAKCLICKRQKIGYVFDTEDLNTIIYVDLYYRDIWLVKREKR